MSRIEALREQLGGIHPLAAVKVKDHLEPYVRAYIENAPFAVMASSNSDGDCDASPKGGLPGFIKIVDDRTLLIPDVGGNRLFQTYDNLETNAKVGLVIMIPGMEVTVRVNGSVQLLEAGELAERKIESEVYDPDDNAGITQGLLLSIDEAYFHCPRAMRFSKVWDTETIEQNKKRSIKDLKQDD